MSHEETFDKDSVLVHFDFIIHLDPETMGRKRKGRPDCVEVSSGNVGENMI